MRTMWLGSAKNPATPHRAILFFLAMSIVFSLLYYVLLPLLEGSPSLADRLSSHRSLSFLDCFYFSVTTQTTVGFGDIIPTTTLGKVCTVIQAAFGYFYIAFLISIFISRATLKSKKTQTYLRHTEETNKVLQIR